MKPKISAVESAMADVPIELDDLDPIPTFANKNGIREATLRNQLRNRAENGLAPAVVRIGKQDRLSKKRYEVWLGMRWSVR